MRTRASPSKLFRTCWKIENISLLLFSAQYAHYNFSIFSVHRQMHRSKHFAHLKMRKTLQLNFLKCRLLLHISHTNHCKIWIVVCLRVCKVLILSQNKICGKTLQVKFFICILFTQVKPLTWISLFIFEFSYSSHCRASTLWFCWFCLQLFLRPKAIRSRIRKFFRHTLLAVLVMVTHSITGLIPVSSTISSAKASKDWARTWTSLCK